jgi:hypothetical protein
MLTYILPSVKVYMNRQAREALGDRIRNSLQLTALRLKPSRLLGVQALTLHYPKLTISNTKIFAL